METLLNSQERVVEAFPFLGYAEGGLCAQLFAYGQSAHLTTGQFISMEGDQCSHVPLVLSGSARVYKTGEGGREITLYRIEPGESCILTASCVLSGEPFPAFAMADDALEALLIPAATFRQWVARYDVWREFVYRLLSRRLCAMIALVEEVAFRRMDARISEYLLDAMQPASASVIETTHEVIAAHLGSSREVVSRLLKDFEHKDLVTLSRGSIRVLDPSGLHEVSTKV